MITKFLKKRNANTNLAYDKLFARIQVHSNGSNTFAFKKLQTTSIGNRLNTESGNRMTNELSQYLIAD